MLKWMISDSSNIFNTHASFMISQVALPLIQCCDLQLTIVLSQTNLSWKSKNVFHYQDSNWHPGAQLPDLFELVPW